MFFVLAKVVGFFLVPSNIIVLSGIAGAALLWFGYLRFATRLLVLGAALFAVCGFTPLGAALTLPLENRFPVPSLTGRPPDGAVILAGMFSLGISERRGVPELNGAADRITVIAGLARRFPGMRIVFSGGSGELFPGRVGEADVAKPLLADFGIDSGRLIFEGRSRDTSESAAMSKALADPKPGERWLLITSAIHMPRSVAAFRTAGFPVEPYPVDWTTGNNGDLLRLPPSVRAGLFLVDNAVHEWIGLVAYRIAGRSPELLPGPQN